MTTWRDRPRVTGALTAGLVAIVVVAMLVGGALASGGDCPADGGGPPRTQR
jgi:hypothetical protein